MGKATETLNVAKGEEVSPIASQAVFYATLQVELVSDHLKPGVFSHLFE